MSSLWVREWRSLIRNRSVLINPIAFMFLGVLLFNLGKTSLNEGLNADAIGTLWLLVLLTSMISLDSAFRRDYENGMLEQIFISAEIPLLVIFVRVLVLWLTTGFLVSVLSPLLIILMGVPEQLMGKVFVGLMVGTPALTFLGAIGASLTVGLGRGGVLLALLILPLYIPVLIFGVGVSNSDALSVVDDASLYWLIFISLASISLAPLAVFVGLKISLGME